MGALVAPAVRKVEAVSADVLGWLLCVGTLLVVGMCGIVGSENQAKPIEPASEAWMDDQGTTWLWYRS
jgi:hypothetical protein